MHRHRSTGFTLIELSIVLVIVGLLIGGLTTGRTLIKTSEIRRDIALIEEVRMAVKLFTSRYHQLPGDLRNSRQFFELDVWHPAYESGNGNGIIGDMRTDHGAITTFPTIGDAQNTCTSCHETTLFWMELAVANLIPLKPFAMSAADPDPQSTPGLGYPSLSANKAFGLTIAGAFGGNNYFFLGTMQDFDQYVRANEFMNDSELAQAIDMKSDDGLARTGRVRNYISTTVDLAGNCHDAITGQYIHDGAMSQCGLRIDAGF